MFLPHTPHHHPHTLNTPSLPSHPITTLTLHPLTHPITTLTHSTPHHYHHTPSLPSHSIPSHTHHHPHTLSITCSAHTQCLCSVPTAGSLQSNSQRACSHLFIPWMVKEVVFSASNWHLKEGVLSEKLWLLFTMTSSLCTTQSYLTSKTSLCQ